MFKKNLSEVWNHFKKDENSEKASCNYCSSKILCKGSSTSGLMRHLSAVHPEKITKRKENEANLEPGPSCSKMSKLQPTILKYTKRQSLAEIVSRLCALDGFSISGVSKSSFIRESLNVRGFQLPKNKTSVMKLIHDYYDSAKLEIIKKIDSYKKERLLSLTLDEWTSFKNRRYLNINIHYADGSYENLGLLRIYGNCSADVLNNLLLQKLASFKISLRDVLAATTDGAAVMKKFGRESSFKIHQLCINHGIQLAIGDILYKKTFRTIANVNFDESNISNSNYSSAEESDEDINTEIHDDEYEVDDDLPTRSVSVMEVREDFKQILNNVRKIVNLFKKSAVRNCVLQKHVKTEHGKELNLILDSQTRWNSITPMLERYLLLKNCIKKTLIDINWPDKLNEEENTKIQELVNVLKPIQLAVEALGARDCNLVTSEGIIKFLFNSVSEIPGMLAKNFLEALQSRLLERRSKDLISLIMFLQNPNNIKPMNEICKYGQFFSKSTIFAIAKYGKELTDHYFFNDNDKQCNVLEEVTIVDVTPNENSLKLSLANAIMASKRPMAEVRPDDSITLLRQLKLYEATGTKTSTLQKLYDSLMTIKPTSTESERVFSISGSIVTKKRVGLSDHSIDVLCFLKTYFKNQQQESKI